jgi:uncharacterized protein (TIGR03382 family)
MEPTSMIIAMGVLALLVIMRRRRTGVSDEAMMDQKRASYGRWPQRNFDNHGHE